MPVVTVEFFPMGAGTIPPPAIAPVRAIQAPQVIPVGAIAEEAIVAVAATREAAAINDALPLTRPGLDAGIRGF
jgi:hypothetical protein